MKRLNMKNVFLYGACVVVLAALCFLLSFLFAEKTTDQDTLPEPSDSAAVSTTVSPSAVQTSAQPTPSASLPAADTTSGNILENGNIEPLPEAITIKINEDTWYLTLVNNQYRMPADYQVQSAPAIPGCQYELDYRVAQAYTAMYNAAAAEGLYLTPYSGLRSYSRQTINYENKTNYYRNQGYSETEAKALAAMVIMPPGCSEHNLGLAMDIIDTADNFYTTAEYAWLMEHAADYGFILRYPKDKQYITKVEYEPWHWRYVGVEHAHAIKNSGLCLEEYLAAIGMMPTPLAEG